MGPSSATPIHELPLDLFPVISSHLPLIYRPSTLLSLALTCHRLYEIVVPQLLYNAVRVEDEEEEQALQTLNMLIAKAEPTMIEEDSSIQKKLERNPSPSHYIHHLFIDTEITEIPNPTSDHPISALQKLIDMDGLPHLSNLTLHINGEYHVDAGTTKWCHLTLTSLLQMESLKKCPHLKSIDLCDFTYEFYKTWTEHELFSNKNLTSIYFESEWNNYPIPNIKFSQLPPNLHTLKLGFYPYDRDQKVDASLPDGLFDCVIPNLDTLILNEFVSSNPTSSYKFWKAHPGIKRLQLGHGVTGKWFDKFESGMLPNLTHLECNIDSALVLVPQASKTLIRLSILSTYNAQGPYLLRAVVPDGVLLALRSLTIHLDSGNSQKHEGHRWREDEKGVVSQADAKRPSRQFDGNYIMSLSKAAPNLEELELMGTSDDTLNSITASLSRFPKLHRFTFSSGVNNYFAPFFARSVNWAEHAQFGISGLSKKNYGKYAPENFNRAARDLANGCRTLNVVTMSNVAGRFSIVQGMSVKIVRVCEGGSVKEMKKIRPWGNIIGKEEEW